MGVADGNCCLSDLGCVNGWLSVGFLVNSLPFFYLTINNVRSIPQHVWLVTTLLFGRYIYIYVLCTYEYCDSGKTCMVYYHNYEYNIINALGKEWMSWGMQSTFYVSLWNTNQWLITTKHNKKKHSYWCELTKLPEYIINCFVAAGFDCHNRPQWRSATTQITPCMWSRSLSIASIPIIQGSKVHVSSGSQLATLYFSRAPFRKISHKYIYSEQDDDLVATRGCSSSNIDQDSTCSHVEHGTEAIPNELQNEELIHFPTQANSIFGFPLPTNGRGICN